MAFVLQLKKIAPVTRLFCVHTLEFPGNVSNTTSIISTRKKSTAAPSMSLPENFQILKPAVNSSSPGALKIKNISKAMKAYLERARKHDDFLQTKNEEFEIGRYHLCNMMGLEIGTLTQNDIDRAIEYLLPSGLYDSKARPMMKPPDKLYPKEKAAQFDVSGRPFNHFFYTCFSNYYESLHKIVEKFHELDAFEDKMIEKGIREPPEESTLKLSSSDWISIDEMRGLFLENIHESDYKFLILTLTRLSDHPYSFRCKEFILKFRKELEDMSFMDKIPELMYDENGRPFMEMIGKRKRCEARVIVRGNGTGKVKINHTDISYFYRMLEREQIMFPLEFTDMLGRVDIEAVITGPGLSTHAGAMRFALAMCLRSFVEPELVEKMRIAGLLTEDKRFRGRKMPGQKGSRAKYKWKKR